MKNPILLLLFSFLLLANYVSAQHTFSIVAVDPVTGEIGSAGATCLDIDDGIHGALIISDIILGIGAIHTQAWWNLLNQAAARERMEMGDSPQEIIDWLIVNDQGNGNIEQRQYGIIDLIGGAGGTPRTAAYTGNVNDPVANHILGPNYSIQGNILISQEVLDDMETEFINASGTLADKLMAAMQGAKRIGADNRCTSNQTSSKSAFLRVAKVEDLYSNYGHLTVDLNVGKTNFAEDPIDVLQTTYDFYLDMPVGITCSNTVSDFPYNESFETDLGLWEQADIDLSQVGNTEFDWTRNSGETPTNNTGPAEASHGDFYLYTEASGGNFYPGKRAVLSSPCFDLSAVTEAFLAFKYHMFGSTVGNLAVRVNDGDGWSTIWLLSGSQGNEWRNAVIDLNEYIGTTIQIRLDSATGWGGLSDVAIDYVRLVDQVLDLKDQQLNSVSVYPNPVTDILTIVSKIQITEIKIYNQLGQLVVSNSNQNTIDLSSLSQGLYFIKIKDENGNIGTQKVVKE